MARKKPSPDQQYLLDAGWTRTRETHEGFVTRVHWRDPQPPHQESTQDLALYVQGKRERFAEGQVTGRTI